MKRSFVKTLIQSNNEFYKVLWNFNKTLIRKTISCVKHVKVSH